MMGPNFYVVRETFKSVAFLIYKLNVQKCNKMGKL